MALPRRLRGALVKLMALCMHCKGAPVRLMVSNFWKKLKKWLLQAQAQQRINDSVNSSTRKREGEID
jgi:hypothetical protein